MGNYKNGKLSVSMDDDFEEKIDVDEVEAIDEAPILGLDEDGNPIEEVEPSEDELLDKFGFTPTEEDPLSL